MGIVFGFVKFLQNVFYKLALKILYLYVLLYYYSSQIVQKKDELKHLQIDALIEVSRNTDCS